MHYCEIAAAFRRLPDRVWRISKAVSKSFIHRPPIMCYSMREVMISWFDLWNRIASIV